MSNRAITALAVLILCLLLLILHFASLLPDWHLVGVLIGVALLAFNQLRAG